MMVQELVFSLMFCRHFRGEPEIPKPSVDGEMALFCKMCQDGSIIIFKFLVYSDCYAILIKVVRQFRDEPEIPKPSVDGEMALFCKMLFSFVALICVSSSGCIGYHAAGKC